jgi:small subunit ribosomal protein S8
MALTDPIADMLTRIRNASAARKDEVEIPYSRIKFEIARILKDEGYVRNVSWNSKGKKKGPIRVQLKYGPNRERVLHGIVRISKPGRRTYSGSKDVPSTLGGLGITIVSTSRGILTDRDARSQKVGGEVLCSVW